MMNDESKISDTVPSVVSTVRDPRIDPHAGDRLIEPYTVNGIARKNTFTVELIDQVQGHTYVQYRMNASYEHCVIPLAEWQRLCPLFKLQVAYVAPDAPVVTTEPTEDTENKA